VNALLVALGASDCESTGSGWLVQPVNALSSLSYSIVGIALVPWVLRGTGGERFVRVVLSTLLVLTGIGSAMYHGPQGTGSGYLHDVSFIAVIVCLAVANIAAAGGWPFRTMAVVMAVATATVALFVALFPSATNGVTAVSAVALVVGDIGLRRVGGIDWRWYTVAIVAFAGALVAFAAGRTGSPLCDPGSTFQWHGVWHVLGAIAIGAYAVATGFARSARVSPT
jgi:hypothetical protein